MPRTETRDLDAEGTGERDVDLRRDLGPVRDEPNSPLSLFRGEDGCGRGRPTNLPGTLHHFRLTTELVGRSGDVSRLQKFYTWTRVGQDELCKGITAQRVSRVCFECTGSSGPLEPG